MEAKFTQLDVRFDASCRALEVSIIPEIWKLGCGLVSQLATTYVLPITEDVILTLMIDFDTI